MKRIVIIALAVLACSAYAGVSLAFPYPYLYHHPASGQAGVNRAGGEGIYGTGGAQDHGIKCSHCHVDGAGTIGVNVIVTKGSATSPTGWDVGTGAADAYEPGATYTITIELTGEHRTNVNPNNTSQRADLNGFSATFEDASGQLAGVLMSDSGQSSASCPATYPYTNGSGGFIHAGPGGGATTVLFGDCHAVLYFHEVARTTWTFSWQAPGAGTGDVTLFLGVVDGDHEGASSLDDDVVERSFVLVEGS